MVGSHGGSRTTSELSWLFPFKQGREAESSDKPGGFGCGSRTSFDKLCKSAMFQIRLKGEALIFDSLELALGSGGWGSAR